MIFLTQTLGGRLTEPALEMVSHLNSKSPVFAVISTVTERPRPSVWAIRTLNNLLNILEAACNLIKRFPKLLFVYLEMEQSLLSSC